MLSLPIVGVDGFTVDMENHFKDPGSIINSTTAVRDCPPPPRSQSNESTWVEVVRLVDTGLRTGGEARKRAAVRLAVLSRWQRLTPEERDQLAGSLWDFGLDCDYMPKETYLHPWDFLKLPEPKPGLAENRLRAGWVRPAGWADGSAESLEKVLGDAGAALRSSRAYGHQIELTTSERDSLRGAVDRWATVGPSTILPWERREKMPGWRENVRNMPTLLLQLEMSREAGAGDTRHGKEAEQG